MLCPKLRPEEGGCNQEPWPHDMLQLIVHGRLQEGQEVYPSLGAPHKHPRVTLNTVLCDSEKNGKHNRGADSAIESALAHLASVKGVSWAR